MAETKAPAVNKWPFLIGDLLILGMVGYNVYYTAAPMDFWEAALCVAGVSLAAFFGVWPFVLEYRAVTRFAEMDAVAEVVGQVNRIEEVAGQIEKATGQWQTVQEHARRVNEGANEIAERMTAEAKAFGEFMGKANDTEKAHLRLETEKLHRAQNDWLQVAVRMLDHVFALHLAASRSGQPELSRQIGSFQFACRDAARRVGLIPYVAEPGEKFDPKMHAVPDSETAPAAPSVVQETVATGYTFQGQLLRPAIVRVQPFPDSGAAAAGPAGKLQA